MLAECRQCHSASALCSLFTGIRVAPGSGQWKVGLKQPWPGTFLEVLSKQQQYLDVYQRQVCL